MRSADKNKHKKMGSRGSVSIFVLVFGVVFATVIGGLVAFGSIEHVGVQRTSSHRKALGIAEAGINYYRWHLAHDPEDYQDGTGLPGPHVHDYADPQGGTGGQFSLEIIPPEEGSKIVTIESTGSTSDHPSIQRKVKAKFGPEPLTQYSFLHNAAVWFGSGLTVFGEVLSNGGIRFDGINESVVRSVQETYLCGSETGCSPSETKPGVWGSGGPKELWEFPVPLFDFDSVLTDFNAMRAAAQNGGIYLGPSNKWGYHLVFEADGTVDVFEVTSTRNRTGWSVEDGCHQRRERINGETLIDSFDLADNKIIYAEDTVWVEGTVEGKTTVVAARLPVGSFSTDMYINGNIVYSDTDGSDSLGIIAQNNIYYVRAVPNNFVINAAMMAQQGRILRRYYGPGCGNHSQGIRDSLTIWGSVISNQKSYWNYGGSSGFSSGFLTREITFNQLAAEEPPPYFPSTEKVRILSWEEDDF